MEGTGRYVIFLDIDGVFTSTRQHLAAEYRRPEGEMWTTFDPVAIDFMNLLDSRYDIDWILSTTWKNGLEKGDPTIYHWISAAFRNAGFTGYFPYPNWKTHDGEVKNGDRAAAIRDFLAAERLTYDDYLIFDDTEYRFKDVLPTKRWIKTDAHEGLLSKHMRNALAITGTWRRKDA